MLNQLLQITPLQNVSPLTNLCLLPSWLFNTLPLHLSFPGVVSIALLLTSSVIADDTEIYDSPVNPNVLLVIDTSQSMLGRVDILSYDPAFDYSSIAPVNSIPCDVDRIYVGGIDSESHPRCDSEYWFEADQFRCDAGWVNLDLDRLNEGSGYYSSKFLAWDSHQLLWRLLDSGMGDQYRQTVTHYECKADRKTHGETWSSASKFINNGPTGPWHTSSQGLWNDVENQQILYTGNYLNWYHYSSDNSIESTNRLAIVKDAAKDFVASATDLNIGVMRFDNYVVKDTYYPDVTNKRTNPHGGSVIYPVSDIETQSVRDDLIGTSSTIGLFDDLSASSTTPLVETIYEGMRYFRGDAVNYGLGRLETSIVSHPDSMINGSYKSPIVSECVGNYMIVFTDGRPTTDDEADDDIVTNLSALSDLPDGLSNCSHNGDSPEPTYHISENNGDSCLDELAYYMKNSDHSNHHFGNNLAGVQDIISFYIGGFDDFDGGLLDEAANAGGSEQSYSASSRDDLRTVFNAISNEIANYENEARFVSSAVSVNALNRVTHNNDLYFAMFEPTNTPHWNGNLKKYQLLPTGADIDGDGEEDLVVADAIARNPVESAVDESTGLFKNDSLSFWYLDETDRDGNVVTKGGAANRLFDFTEPDLFDAYSRSTRIFTYLTDYSPDAVEFDGGGIELTSIHESNADPSLVAEESNTITKLALGLDVSISDDEFIKRVKWLRGVDIKDEDKDRNDTEGRPIMGGILHSEPIVINYSTDDKGTEDPDDDTQTNIILVTTNDGYLHIFKTEPDNNSSRMEHTAVMPKSQLAQMDEIYNNYPGNIAYRLDGNIEVWRYESPDDSDDDITVNGDDHVYAYFGQRRGGNTIFAFDITDPDNPKLLWEINPENVPDDSTDSGIAPFNYMGQTWSKPRLQKVLAQGVSATELVIKDVLIFGGGYDLSNDSVDGARNNDVIGSTLYIVDAKTGKLLWWAGNTGLSPVTPDLENADMRYSFAADTTTVDFNGDGIIESLFAADSGGQIWRFDINNRVDLGDSFDLADRITGGVIADLQLNNPSDTETNANNRRLYNAPDVFIIQPSVSDPPFLGIAIGTGFRAHPKNSTVSDRFFILKYIDIQGNLSYSDTKLYGNDLLDVSDLNFVSDSPVRITDSEKEDMKNNGWYINFSGVGEKSLSKSITVDGSVIFTSYIPPDGNECHDPGTGKVYVINVVDGSPVSNWDGLGDTDNLELDDRSRTLKAKGIPPKPTIIFPDIQDVGPQLIVGNEIVPINPGVVPKLTYWVQLNVK